MAGERIEGEEQNNLGGTLRPTGRTFAILQAFKPSSLQAFKPSRLATHVDHDTGEFSSGGGWQRSENSQQLRLR
jgi:hypothetical protein